MTGLWLQWLTGYLELILVSGGVAHGGGSLVSSFGSFLPVLAGLAGRGDWVLGVIFLIFRNFLSRSATRIYHVYK